MSTLHDDLLEMYERRATGRYGLEHVSQLQHALQTAAQAERVGAAPALALACLLHDVGHLVHKLGENPAAQGVDDMHEVLGAKWLAKRGLPPAVTEPVRLHVAAKRYLCGTEPDYFGKLAPDSVLSLSLQGGPMSTEEAVAFRAQPFAADAVALRRFDEAAKNPHAQTPDAAHYLKLLDAL
ncbi:MAG: HD domain-containing protein [Alphaproteobacteria bacterium]|nr:HD domain-containing protein [Alphaproteobacteria bacterium]MBL6937359.1 HD domain-containing protein [Alphaproteobacteria bacterium]MBL7096079.1 HD domain-containing protein [Alphaproteobacteria bacterium]